MEQRQREAIAKMAIKKFGQDAQLRQLQEECAELIAAVNHHFRQRQGARYELLEEVADVTIMLMQLTPILSDTHEVENIIDSKLERLSSRL